MFILTVHNRCRQLRHWYQTSDNNRHETTWQTTLSFTTIFSLRNGHSVQNCLAGVHFCKPRFAPWKLLRILWPSWITVASVTFNNRPITPTDTSLNSVFRAVEVVLLGPLNHVVGLWLRGLCWLLGGVPRLEKWLQLCQALKAKFPLSFSFILLWAIKVQYLI